MPTPLSPALPAACLELSGRRRFKQPAAIEKQHVLPQTLGLRAVVCRHHYGGAGCLCFPDHVFDELGGGKIQMRCRLVEEQDVGLRGKRADQGQFLLLAA